MLSWDKSVKTQMEKGPAKPNRKIRSKIIKNPQETGSPGNVSIEYKYRRGRASSGRGT